MTSAVAGPSQFAQLLKRSKFASFDPSIAQIYTSHGGYAHRGDFGFKRPFPATARRSVPYVVVKDVDDSMMQTEWNVAENQGRWMKRITETGAGAKAEIKSPWNESGQVATRWDMYSTFDKSGAHTDPKSLPRPMNENWSSMTKPQFDAYLNRMRHLRPEFKEFLHEKWLLASKSQTPTSAPIIPLFNADGEADLPLASTDRSAHHREYLQSRKRSEESELSDRRITPFPHTNAGLSYTYENSLQTALLNPPSPARMVDIKTTERERHYTREPPTIALGGTLATSARPGVAEWETENSLKLAEVARGAPVSRGEIQAHVEYLSVISPPNVVGVHNGLGGTQVKMKAAQYWVGPEANQSANFNPHPVGSQAYVDHAPEPYKLQPFTAWSGATLTSQGKGNKKNKTHDVVRSVKGGFSALNETLARAISPSQPSDKTK